MKDVIPLGTSGRFANWVNGVKGEDMLHRILIASTSRDAVGSPALPPALYLSVALSLLLSNEMKAEVTPTSRSLSISSAVWPPWKRVLM